MIRWDPTAFFAALLALTLIAAPTGSALIPALLFADPHSWQWYALLVTALVVFMVTAIGGLALLGGDHEVVGLMGAIALSFVCAVLAGIVALVVLLAI